jgi:glycosyltransferase involved in cell wall biosynthesis
VKIALVSEHASPLALIGGVDAGGQNVHVGALARALAQRGHQVTVFTRRDDPGLATRVELAPGVIVEHLDAGPATVIAKDELLPHIAEFALRLAGRLADEQPDVLHAHFWMSGLAAVRAAAVTGVPVVQTFHALGAVKRRWQGEADTSPATRVATESSLARQVDRIIATCRDEVDELLALGAPRDRIDLVPCGVDLDLFRPDGARAAAARPRLLAVGRLVPRKGLDDLIQALTRLPDVELVVAGGPPAAALDSDPEARRLRQLTADLGVADRVRLLGQLSRSQLPPLFRSAAAVLCVPWYEPFGIVPLEAMACGVPVVASAVGGLRDTVVDGVTGRLVLPHRPDLIAARVGELLADPELAARLGRAGVDRVRAHYGWDRVAAATEDSYRQASAGRTQWLSRLEVVG